MKVPLELSTRGLTPETARGVQDAVRDHARKLDAIAPDLMSCRVAVERPQRRNARTGNDYRVRIVVTLPPGKELVVSLEPSQTDQGDALHHVIRSAFHAIERQVKQERARRRGDVKTHAMELAFVVRLFPDRGYGFLRDAVDGHELFFHRNSVLNHDFDRLAVGTEVRYVEELGAKGPQASTVQIVDKPGERLPEDGPSAVETPEAWRP